MFSLKKWILARDLYSPPPDPTPDPPPPKKNPKSSKIPPSPAKSTPQIFWYVSEVYTMEKVLEDGGKWVKINFPLRFLYVNFKIFSKISNLNWFFTQTCKNLSLGFLFSFIIIKAFQNSIKIALILIKISFFKSKFAKISWKVSKFCRFPLIFRLVF